MKKLKEFLLRLKKSEKGFTLIELIIVIAIIGIIAAIAAPNLMGNVKKAKDNADKANATIIGNAVLTAIANDEFTLPSSTGYKIYTTATLDNDVKNYINTDDYPTPNRSGDFIIGVDNKGNVKVGIGTTGSAISSPLFP